jgi:hypothetical protein
MRSVLVHGVLALLGLAAAFWVWNEGDRTARAAESVTLFACSDGELASVQLKTEKKAVSVAFDRKNGTIGGWITVSIPNEATPTAPSVDRFAASDKVQRVVERIAPLVAERSLGDVNAEKLKALGLTETQDSIAVTCGGETRTFEIGAKTYGGRTRYTRGTKGGPVHLIANGLINDLEMAEHRFMQRDLVRFRLAEIDEVKVSGKAGTKTLLHRNRRDHTKQLWVAAEAPEQRNELYGNWLSKVLRLRALDYLEKGAEPGAGAGRTLVPEQIARLAFSGDKKDTIELVRIPGAKPNDHKYYARSTATGAWVTVPKSLADQVAEDVPTVLGVEPEATDAPSAATATNEQRRRRMSRDGDE